MASKYNWSNIQKDYELNNLSKRELREKYGFSNRSLYLAIKRGDIILRDGKTTNQLKRTGQISPSGFKWCNSCKINLPYEYFNKKHGCKLQPYCRECGKVHSKNYYRQNQKHQIKQIKTRKKKYKEVLFDNLWDLFCKSGCAKCGIKNPVVLEFDHIERASKKENISKMLQKVNTWEGIKKELDKCQILCSNCHKMKTHEEDNSWRWKRHIQTNV